MRQLVLAIAAVVAVLFVATPASAATTGFTTATVHMRSGPSVHHSIVTVIPRGRQVTVLECLRAPRWCQVVWRGYRGWVYSRYLSTTYLPGYSTYPPSVYLEFDILPGLRYHGPRRPRYHSPRPRHKWRRPPHRRIGPPHRRIRPPSGRSRPPSGRFKPPRRRLPRY